ncbi:hypothetical protein [Aquitalea aquatica]|uniref:Uncharacterized protein n=1 Tax=Aquitalea aquatica TaxID=3044273 RepID=A0A838Y1Z8_9NEIS|nr:hypothetical protein [Aquitalea magnusonii]MBA4709233.1 hypothetical protein [Aquitalea magnusonii]
MENIYKISTGIILFIITSIVTYLFRMRQLYVASPTLFKRTELSTNGSVSQIFIYNKGNHVEEDITVALDPSLKAELLASDTPGLSIAGNNIIVDRLHKNRSASALLLIENGIFDYTKINSITSKATEGKIIKRVADVPPNAAKFFIFVIFIIAIFLGLFGADHAYSYVKNRYLEYRLKPIYEQGWHNLSNYYDSELRKSYGDQEFPVRYMSTDTNGPRPTVTFEVYNKAAVPLEVTADKNHKLENTLTNFANVTIPAMSHSTLIVPIPNPDPTSHMPEIAFTFKSGEEFIYEFYLIIPKQ